MKVPTNFTQSQLKKSYREFMMNTHPDTIKDEQQKLIAQQQYIEIQNINNVLKNPKQKAIYNQFGAVQQAKTKNFNRQNEEESQQQQEVQLQLFVQRETFIVQTDLFLYYSLLTISVIVFTQEERLKNSRIPSFLILSIMFYYDYCYTFDGQNLLDQFINLIFKQQNYLIIPEKQNIIRIFLPIIFNFFRSCSIFVYSKNDKKILKNLLYLQSQINSDKLGNESKIQSDLNEQIQKQNEHSLNNKYINQNSVQSHLEELIQDLEQDNKLEISKKNSKSTKIRKFAQKKTQFILFPILIYYIYSALFADQPHQIKQFQEQQQQQQQYHNQKYQEQYQNNQQQYQRERRRQRNF